MAELLQETPYAGIKLKNNKDELYRKLIVPHFPFTLLYHYEKKSKTYVFSDYYIQQDKSHLYIEEGSTCYTLRTTYNRV